jgi:hypothetical protein
MCLDAASSRQFVAATSLSRSLTQFQLQIVGMLRPIAFSELLQYCRPPPKTGRQSSVQVKWPFIRLEPELLVLIEVEG